jgi:hypothetical protein
VKRQLIFGLGQALVAGSFETTADIWSGTGLVAGSCGTAADIWFGTGFIGGIL